MDKHELRPAPDAVEDVLTWKTLKTDTQLMSYLGFAICCPELIKEYAVKVERLEHKQANQAEIKEGFYFSDKDTYEALTLMRWMDKSGHTLPGTT